MRKAIISLLKPFQIEIDSLTEPPNHITEESLLEIYQHFSEFPGKSRCDYFFLFVSFLPCKNLPTDPVQAHQYAQTLPKSLEKVSDLALPTSLGRQKITLS